MVAHELHYLLQNNPRETFFKFHLQHFNSDDLSEALRTNEHVKIIELEFLGLTNNSNWDSLLRVIATREILENVTLKGGLNIRGLPRFYNFDLVPPFLLAIQQNPRIQSVAFSSLHLSGNVIASFLDTATFVTTLELGEGDMLAPGGVLAVAAALQRNTNILRLKLSNLWLKLRCLAEMYMIPIVRSLASNTTLTTLQLDFAHFSLDESLAVGNLLESTTTIERLELHLGGILLCDGGIEANQFRPIAQGMILSSSVTHVRFVYCRFGSPGVVRMLNGVLESKSNLQSLAMEHCSVHEDGQEEFRAAISSVLQRHSLLRSLELISHGRALSLYGFGTPQDFARLCTAVELSPLESFALETIVSRELCLVLLASIPKMQVRSLQLRVHDNLSGMIRGVLGAVKQNATFRTVIARSGYLQGNWCDNFYNRKFLSYSARNEFLAQWTENPALVPDAAWPQYLAVAQVTGPDAVFRILVSLTLMKLLSCWARNEFLAQWTENPALVPDTAWSEYLAVAQTTGPDTVFRILVSLTHTLWASDA